LTVDGGALLFNDEKIFLRQRQQLTTTARGLVRAYNFMGYQAVGIARQDLGGGLDFLREIQKESDFPWLSANLVGKKDHKPIFSPGVVIEQGRLKIALLGLTGDGADTLFTAKDNAVILPWPQVLADLLPGFAAQADFVILLSNLPFDQNKKIATLFPQIHLIIQAGVATANIAPQLINNTLITQTEKQGKHIGLLKANWNREMKKWDTEPNKELLGLKKELDKLTWQLARYRKKGDPEEVFKDKANTLAAYHQMLRQEEALRQAIAGLSHNPTIEAKSNEEPSTYQGRFLAMEKEVPDHPEVLAIVNATTKEANAINKNIFASQDEATPPPYLGSATCLPCHEKQGKKWQKSKHARAYETLIAKNQQFNPQCIPCHITVDPELADIGKAELKKELLMVSCESCHGSGAGHVQSPQDNKLTMPDETICHNCHTPDHDDDFKFKRDLDFLQCGS